MSSSRIGIIAGDGNLPKILINQIEDPFVVGISGFFDESNVNCQYIITSLEKFGFILNCFHQNNVEKIIMAGGVGTLNVNKFKPQDKETETLIKIITDNDFTGEDAILRTTIDYINSQGFTVIGVEEILGEQVIPVGILTQTKPNNQNTIDIELGRNKLKHISRLDMGQCVVVQNNKVIITEDENGTDAMINSAGELKQPNGKPVLVKGKKENQTKLADLPVIGIQTVENVANMGFAGIAVFSNGTIILDKDAVINRANQLKIFIVVI